MKPYGRRLIVHLGFEAAVGEVSRAIRDEGLEIIGRIDVRADETVLATQQTRSRRAQTGRSRE